MKKTICLLLVLASLFALCACGAQNEAKPAAGDAAPAAQDDAAAAPSEGKRILRIVTTETAQSYSPTDSGSLHLYLAYEFLSTADENGVISPWLAEEITWLDETTMKI